MEINAFVTAWWPVLLCFVGLVAWAVRLEYRGASTEKEVSKLAQYTEKEVSKIERRLDIITVKHEELDSKVVEQLAQVRESLARIEGALGVKHDA